MKLQNLQKLQKNQKGFSLFMVMVLMIVIALLVVVTSQTTSTETRLGTNEADRKFALENAEHGLRAGEDKLSEWVQTIEDNLNGKSSTAFTTKTFSEACTNGLCAPTEEVTWKNGEANSPFKVNNNGASKKAAWERDNVLKGDFKNSIASADGKMHYIIEYLGEKEYEGDSSLVKDYFRITSRSQGDNENTNVTLQSYVEMVRKKTWTK